MNKPDGMERGTRAIALRNGLSRRVRVALIAGAWVVYALAFIPLYHLIGPSVPAMATALVGAVGWLFGVRAGLLAGLLAFPLHAMLFTFVTREGWGVMMGGGLAGSISLVLTGAMVGWLSNLRQQVKQELADRKRTGEELQRAHDTLEIRVQERTADLARTNEELQAEITERKQAEEKLQQAAKEWQATFDSITDFISIHDKHYNLVRVNSALADALKTKPEQLIGRKCYELFHGTNQPWPDCPHNRALETSTTCVACFFEPHLGIPIEVSCSPVSDETGQILGTFHVTKDITERKQAEEEMRVKEMQLIHAGRLSSLGEMATGVAHEINQPLAIISLAAEGRLRDIRNGRFDASILPQELEDILKNVRRIDRIITHMRTFAHRTGEWESVEPEEVLDNVFILLGEQFRMHQISVSHEIEDGLPAIEVDVNQLEQVFVNILTNARQVLDEKAEEAAGCGEAFEKRFVCSISKENREEREYVVYEFADSAFGVPDELKTKLFDPFFTTKEAGQGTGLGLSIAYSIVTGALGGKIWVEDNDMGGASFKVALPLGEAPCASTS